MEAIVVALITGGFGLLIALQERFRRENRSEHASTMDRLDLVSSEIRKDIRQVRHELNDHINGPAHTDAKVSAKKPPKAG